MPEFIFCITVAALIFTFAFALLKLAWKMSRMDKLTRAYEDGSITFDELEERWPR